MVLDQLLPHETGDPMERVRAAQKAKGLVVPLSDEQNRAIAENQIHNPKMGFESDSAHPEPVVVPVSSQSWSCTPHEHHWEAKILLKTAENREASLIILNSLTLCCCGCHSISMSTKHFWQN